MRHSAADIIVHLFIFVTLSLIPVRGRYVEPKSGIIAECEADILELGTKMADEFNKPIGRHNWNERTIQNGIVER
jgi:hypothetical protein